MYRQMSENISAVAREVGIPMPTLWRWVQTGKIRLPDDLELLKKVKRIGGRWYLQEPEKGQMTEQPGREEE